MSSTHPKVHNGIRKPWTNVIKLTGYSPLQSENREKLQCENEVYAIEIHGISNDAGLEENGSCLNREKERRLKRRFCCLGAAVCWVAVLIFILIGALTCIMLRANENSSVQGANFNRSSVTYAEEQTEGVDKGHRDTTFSYKTDVQDVKFGNIQIRPLDTTESSKESSLLKRLKRTPGFGRSISRGVARGVGHSLGRNLGRTWSRSSKSRGSSGTPEVSAFSIIISLVLACSQVPIFTKIHL